MGLRGRSAAVSSIPARDWGGYRSRTAAIVQSPRDVLRHSPDQGAPPDGRERELSYQRWRHPTHTPAGLEEVVGREPPSSKEVEDIAVDDRTDRLHQVGRERVPIELVGMEDTEPRIQPGSLRRERCQRSSARGIGRLGRVGRHRTLLQAGSGTTVSFGLGSGRSRRPRRSCALAATMIVERLIAIAPTAIGRSIPHGTRMPAAIGIATRL